MEKQDLALAVLAKISEKDTTPVILARLQKPNFRQSAFLLFTLLDRKRQSIAPDSTITEYGVNLRRRMMNSGMTGPSAYVQVQVLIITFTGADGSVRQDAEQLLAAAIPIAAEAWQDEDQ